MATIFISHSSKDNDAAAKLRYWLREDRGYDSLFLDFDPELGIAGGVDWKQELYDRLHRCQAVIVLLSEHWLSSKWCFAEAVQARGGGKKLVFVKIAPCKPDSAFSEMQQVDLTGESCSVEDGYRKLRRALTQTFNWSGDRPPYPGLPSFDEADAAIFFGRDQEIQEASEALERLKRNQPAAPRFLLILGASGSGKSSLMRAGVLPRLAGSSSRWLALPPFLPGNDPVGALAGSLVNALARTRSTRSVRDIRALLSEEDNNAQSLSDLLEDLRLWGNEAEREATVLVPVDQIDDLTASTEEARAFWRLLWSTLQLGGGRVLALGTLRSDLMGRFQEHPGVASTNLTQAEALRYETLTLDPLPHDRFRQIILGPAQLVGLEIEPALVDQMVDDAHTRDALPLLSFVLHRMWADHRIRADMKFALREYKALGGIEEAVCREAEAAREAVLSLAGDRQSADRELQALFIPGLVELKEDDVVTRRYADLDELPSNARELMRPFIAARLLLTDSHIETQADGSTVRRERVRVAHEAMIRNWPTLVRWIDQDRSKLTVFAEVERDADDWKRYRCSDELLNHRDSRLQLAEDVLSEPRFARAAERGDARAYLRACRALQTRREADQREEQERRLRDAKRIAEEQAKVAGQQRTVARRTLIGLAVTVVLLLIATGLYIHASRETSRAEAATKAETAARSAAESAATEARQRFIDAQLAAMRANAEQNFARANFNTLLASRTRELPPRPDKDAYLGRLEQDAAEFRARGNGLLQQAFNLAALPPDQQFTALEAPKAVPRGNLTFSVQALRVRHGTALLIRYGTNEKQNTILYGGGPLSAFVSALLPALNQEIEQSQKRLRFELVILPQQDDEYLGGVNRLLSWLDEAKQHGKPLPLELGGLWHNHFAPLAVAEEADWAAVPYDRAKDYPALAARRLRIPINEPFDYFVSAARDGPARVHLASGMSITVIGPTPDDLEALHEFWRRSVGERFTGQLVSLVDQIGGLVEGYSSPQIELIRAPDILPETVEFDRSVVNLSSMLLLLEFGRKRLLLCGDARGSQIVRGLISAGLLRRGSYVLFDAILVPHSGSSNNVSLEFFQQVRANHYIFSGDGRFGNPPRKTIQMLIDARGDAEYQIHFNHPIDQLDTHRAEEWRKRRQIEERRRQKDPSQEVQADWSPEQQGLAALLAQHARLTARSAGTGVNESPVIDLAKPLGSLPQGQAAEQGR